MTGGGTKRRSEVLDVAAAVFESAGIRASINDIAEACGLKTGSLYHHFASKEAIIVELVRRYLRDLEQLAAAAIEHADGTREVSLSTIEQFGSAIAECAIRHRAALLLTFHEPPMSYGPELAQLAARVPDAIDAAMRKLLDRAHAAGLLRDRVDREVLADRICQNMLHVGVGVFHRTPAAKPVPILRCRMLLSGLARAWPADADLDRSPARAAAGAVIARWPPPRDPAEDRHAHILSVATAEFGRRGYESTTIRQVAASAGVSTKAVYGVARSKDELLWRILGSYAENLIGAWDAVLDADATPLEKLDALLWLNINTIDRYAAENNILAAFLQFAPPTSPDLDLPKAAKPIELDVPFAGQLAKVGELLAAGERAGEFVVPEASPDVQARCVFALIWMPHNIVDALGVQDALRFARETLLRGAAVSRESR